MMRDVELSNHIFLTQTDTTIGLLSQDSDRLSYIKERLPNKHYIKALPSLKTLKLSTRVPQIHKNRVRRSNRTTFIFPNGESYRIIKDKRHRDLIDRFGWLYTTSANLSGEKFDEEFALKKADIVVKYPIKNRDTPPSKLIKLSQTNLKRLR
jgi:tRNA A37 threonylcarbamoyladenosine synthetase subunit TsaC/SUA5/YrdC